MNSNVFQQTISASTVKVEYTVQTNVESSHSEARGQRFKEYKSNNAISRFFVTLNEVKNLIKPKKIYTL